MASTTTDAKRHYSKRRNRNAFAGMSNINANLFVERCFGRTKPAFGR